MFSVSKIKSIRPIGVHKVCDITVKEDHSYLANGFVNHNSKNPNLQQIPTRIKLPDEDYKNIIKGIK